MSALVEAVGYWAEHYDEFAAACVKLKGKNGAKFSFDNPHPGQRKLRKKVLPGKQMRMVLKARQVGSTSEIAAEFVHLCLFEPGTSIAVAAQTDKGVKGISALYGHIVRNLPDHLRTGLFAAKIGIESISWPRLNSEIVFGTANSDSFRGVPRQGCHITEAAFVKDLVATLEALRPTVHGLLVLESTANGPNDFYDLWEKSTCEKIFISWMDDTSCRSKLPLPTDLTEKEIAFIRDNKCDVEQASWAIHTIRDGGNWNSFNQEHPTKPADAWILGGHRYFSVYFYPDDVVEDEGIKYYAEPKIGRKYVIGVDCASGAPTGDRSTAVLLDVTDRKKITTVARLACRDNNTNFAKRVFALGKKYYNPIICVERNAGYGLTVLSVLRKLGARLYRSKVYDEIKKVYIPRYGFATNATTRPLLLNALQNVIDNEYYIPDDALIEDELNAFRFNDHGKPEAISGKHDDLVIACALAVVAIDQAYMTVAEKVHKRPVEGSPFAEILQYEMRSGQEYDAEEDDD